uniref:non-specific serine/threonine protein kinase n=1 Tax=Chenopodium quinoa TaxID=63459 RepID=A0A803LTH7_CHEQI
MRFTYEVLRTATDNFNTERKLGHGGCGSVFKGMLSDGTKIAVKRLDHIGHGRREFAAEVRTIGNIHHVNLVKLFGFCAEDTHRLLIYEYISNGSLDKWIFHSNLETNLGWDTRKKIILHIARGLAYLHEGCHKRIAHLDVKPQHVLLDDKFNARSSDFGLATLIDRDESFVMTQMRGTPGYLAREWLGGRITEKADVYSYGIGSYIQEEKLNLFTRRRG